ncbi:hypothetical protein [Actinophytocola glycyrrhizae]|uniref:YbaB/EbfC DNA-binding family protein n=1 Tax=Actinophytocola glycyrrhizae TaxID=2044873 RepID=A0ABV9RUY8_9PSEU
MIMGMNDIEERAHVHASVGVHAGVEITVALDRNGGISAEIHIGGDGPGLTMDFADVDSLDRLASVATDGARRLRDRATEHEADLTCGNG